MKSIFKLTNLNCEACRKVVIMSVADIPGVKSSDVDLKTGELRINAEREISKQEIIEALKDTHYKVL